MIILRIFFKITMVNLKTT